jgi:hypothetical protein
MSECLDKIGIGIDPLNFILFLQTTKRYFRLKMAKYLTGRLHSRNAAHLSSLNGHIVIKVFLVYPIREHVFG